MIVPVRTSTIARTAPTARVRRNSGPRNDRVAATAEEGETITETASGAFVLPADPRERRAIASRASAGFLSALLTLRRGG